MGEQCKDEPEINLVSQMHARCFPSSAILEKTNAFRSAMRIHSQLREFHYSAKVENVRCLNPQGKRTRGQNIKILNFLR